MKMRTKTTIQKVMAFFLMLALTVGMYGMPARAEIQSTDTGTITVSNIPEEDAGIVTVSAYKLMDVRYNYDDQTPESPVYSWVQPVQDWLNDSGNAYHDFADANDFSSAAVEDAGGAAAFYDALAAAIKDGTINLPATNTRTGNGDITGLVMGNYLVLIEGGMNVYRASAVNLVPQWDETEKEWNMTTPADVSVKHSPVSLDKSINEDEDDGHPSGKDSISTDGNITGKDNADIGDVITFHLRADIPTYPANALETTYAISDQLPAGLTLSGDNFHVYGVPASGEGDQVELSIEKGDYTRDQIRPGELGSSSFTLHFAYDKIKNYDKIHITYQAQLNEGANIGPTGNINTAWLDYSNNPYVEDSYKTMEDKTAVYSYGIDVSKVDANNTETMLAGAKFQLTRDGNDDPVSFVRLQGGIYRLAMDGDANKTTTLEVGGDGDGAQKGKLTLKGLDAGVYNLTETDPPGGYNRITTPIRITITDEEYDGSVVVQEGQDQAANGLVPVTVPNTSGFQLPTTGGMGTVIFTAAGVLLVGAGLWLAFIFLRRRRREAQ